MDNEAKDLLKQHILAQSNIEYKKFKVIDRDGTNIWVVETHSEDPDLEGTQVEHGMPYQAKDVPVGTQYSTTLIFPKEKECKDDDCET